MADPAPSDAFAFERTGRSRAAILTLGGLYAVLFLAWARLDAAPWILGIVALVSLPALWEAWRDSRAGLVLGDESLSWFSGRRAGELPLDELRAVRFDTRLDLSVRMSLLLLSGRRLRLPAECVPPMPQIEAALTARDIPFERHHFAFF